MSLIFTPLDGSALSRRALPYAIHLARATRAQLLLWTATPTPSERQSTNAHTEAARGLADAAKSVTDAGVVVETSLRYVEKEPLARALIDEANLRNASMIVMSTHGRSGLDRWLHGSVADEVLRAASAPVLLIPPGVNTDWSAAEPFVILAPLDGSDLAEQALAVSAMLAGRLNAELLLLQTSAPTATPIYSEPVVVIPFDPEVELAASHEYLERVAEPLRQRGLPVAVHAAIGQPADIICKVARDAHCAMIAMGSHGRGGLSRLALGSVATSVLPRSPTPVLIVRDTRQPVKISEAVIARAGQPAGSGD